MNENAQYTQCFSLDHAIIKLLFYEEKNVIVTMTDNLLLSQHAVMPEGETKELSKVEFACAYCCCSFASHVNMRA